jgi:hypothetical protein
VGKRMRGGDETSAHVLATADLRDHDILEFAYE